MAVGIQLFFLFCRLIFFGLFLFVGDGGLKYFSLTEMKVYKRQIKNVTNTSGDKPSYARISIKPVLSGW